MQKRSQLPTLPGSPLHCGLWKVGSYVEMRLFVLIVEKFAAAALFKYVGRSLKKIFG